MKLNGIKIRPSLQRFVLAMELKLQKNDHKGGWKEEDDGYFYDRIGDEMQELYLEIIKDIPNSDNVKNEAVDIANFAMMLFDNQ